MVQVIKGWILKAKMQSMALRLLCRVVDLFLDCSQTIRGLWQSHYQTEKSASMALSLIREHIKYTHKEMDHQNLRRVSDRLTTLEMEVAKLKEGSGLKAKANGNGNGYGEAQEKDH